jgi:starvation-inducible outer membrane lipoprotein
MKQNLLARFFKELKAKQQQNATTQPIDISQVAESGILGAVIGDIVGSTHEFRKNKEYNLTENDVESIQTWLLKLKYPTKKSDVNDFKSFDSKSWKYLAGIVGKETAETWHSKLNQPA